MEAVRKKRLCVVTSTRADWGLLSPVCRAIRSGGHVDIDVVATNMHLIEQYGYTYREIESDGFDIAYKVATEVSNDTDTARAEVMALTMSGMAKAFEVLKPDAVLLLGDRYEMLAVASTAAVVHIPVIHIAGGEITVGALDDAFRHAITKLSSLHLTATEEYRNRVIQLGENPETVVNTGAIGVWNAFNTKLMSADELSESIGFDVSKHPLAVVTYHPATNDTVSPQERMAAFLEALDQFPDMRLVITAPNNDAGGECLLRMLEDYVADRGERAILVRSLGMIRYQSLLRCADLVIGNSSSGIVEVPSAGIPTVDIGIRQQGRIAARSVIHCQEGTPAIVEAINLALSPEMKYLASERNNPYYKADTRDIMVKAIESFMYSLPLEPKLFYDLK